MGYIYLITSPSGKYYVGQTTKTIQYRWGKHVYKALSNDGKRECRYLNSAIRKYGPSDFTIEILEELDNHELNDAEKIYILFLESHYSFNRGGYNISWGGSHIIDNHTIETREKLSDIQRKYISYDLPMNVVEIHDKGNNAHGFMYITKDKRYSFTSMNMTMEEKYSEVMKCYNAVNNGDIYIRKNLRKKGTDELDIPTYISRKGDNGFAVQKPGYPRKGFTSINNSREENLQLAIDYLNSLN